MNIILVVGLSFAFGSLMTFWIINSMFRVYVMNTKSRWLYYESRLKEKEEKIKNQSQAVQQLLFEINHKGPRPAAANLLGLCNLLDRDLESLGENISLIENGPEHFNYAKIARTHFDAIKEYAEKIRDVGQKWMDHTREVNRNTEHLQ